MWSSKIFPAYIGFRKTVLPFGMFSIRCSFNLLQDGYAVTKLSFAKVDLSVMLLGLQILACMLSQVVQHGSLHQDPQTS